MRKLLILIGLCLTLSLSGQLLPGVVASQGVVSGCGGGSDNYGIDDHTGALDTYMVANYIYYTNVTVVTCGTLVSYACYTSDPSTQAYIALYTDVEGEPGDLVENSISEMVNESDDQYNVFTIAVSPSVLSGTNYWIALLSTSGNHQNYNSEGGSQTVKYEEGSTFPETASIDATVGSNKIVPIYIVVNH